MIYEMGDVLKHEFKKLIRWIIPKYPFVSNEELAAKISAKLRQTRSSSVVKIQRVISDFHRITLNNVLEISLGSGERMDLEKMHGILKGLSLLQERAFAMEHDADRYLNNALADIMFRFGSPAIQSDIEIHDEQNKAFLEAAKLDTMKRVAQLHLDTLTKSLLQWKTETTELKVQRQILRVVVEKARNLPKMDLGNGVDVFCALFVEGLPGLYQTDILRGSCEADWTWGADQTFAWDLGLASANATQDVDRKLVVMVYDKDQISSDDVIGCITIRLGELQYGMLDEWREILRPQSNFFPAQVIQQRLADKPELKLKVKLECGNLDAGLMSVYDEPGGHSASVSSPPVSLNGDYASSGSLVLCPPNMHAHAFLKTP
jgi:hypothetical protein